MTPTLWKERYLRDSYVDRWRERYSHSEPGGLYYVFVQSPPDEFTREQAERRAKVLAEKFSNYAFGTILTARLDGTNLRWAVVLASGLTDRRIACDVNHVAVKCGIASGAYVYFLPGKDQPGAVVSNC